MRIYRIILYLISLTITCCTQDSEVTNDNTDNGISVNHIYGDGSTYCAFTSLIKRNNSYYLAFREGATHVAEGDFGVIRILKSNDGDHWETIQTLSAEGIDLRDPNLSVMPDDKILLLCGARLLDDEDTYVTRTYYSIESNKDHFSYPQLVNLPQEVCWDECSWVWRLTWQDNVGYGVCYGDGGITLVKTIDGKTFDVVKHLDISGEPNECQIRFTEDKTAYMMVRRSGETGRGVNGYLGISTPPYNQWKWKELSIYLAGQDFIIDKNRMVVATRMTQNIGDRTSVWFGNLHGDFSRCYTLPYGGESGKSDTAYAGLLNEEKEYWVSYYAIHEGEKPSIYLVKLSKNAFGSLYDN